MLLYIIAILCYSSACQAIGGDEKLKWPESYSLEAIRISLTSGLIEEYKVWKTHFSSRIDFSKGAVKNIITASDDYEYGIKYEIHAETTAEKFNVMKCLATIGTEYIQIESEEIYPLTFADNLKSIGHEAINDENTVKFFYKDSNSKKEERHTFWAKYEEKQVAWIPIRYEIIAYKPWLGSLYEHEIWNFYNVKFDIDDQVFSTEMYNCTKKSQEIITSNIKNTTILDPEKDEHVDHVFKTFKSKFSRNYAHQKEHAIRRAIFQNKLRLILSTNRRNLGYKLTINQFADRTPEEMRRYQGLQRRPEGKVGNIPFPYTATKIKDIVTQLPAEYDLRILGYVTKVKNQEECGSCWSFGTAAAVEGALARVNGGRLKTLSNQVMIDCAWPFGANGCNGGSDNAAYEWMMKYGLPTEAEYGPYLSNEGFCRIQNMTTLYSIRGFTDVTPYSVEALKVALINHGPLSVSVDVTNAFQLYSSGVFYDTTCKPDRLNHEVALVGYGERDGETFWILKNSWGPNWGVDGYMLISSRDNNCGVTTEPTYAVF